MSDSSADFELSEVEDLVRIRRAGEVDLLQLAPTLPRLVEAHPERRRFRMLLDYREATLTSLSRAEVASLVAQDRVVMGDVDVVRMAVVVGSDVAFGIIRMYASLTAGSPMDIEVFRDLDEAEAWIEASPD